MPLQPKRFSRLSAEIHTRPSRFKRVLHSRGTCFAMALLLLLWNGFLFYRSRHTGTADLKLLALTFGTAMVVMLHLQRQPAAFLMTYLLALGTFVICFLKLSSGLGMLAISLLLVAILTWLSVQLEGNNLYGKSLTDPPNPSN